MKGVNVSQLCRDAIDSQLRLSGGSKEMLSNQLIEVRKQIQMLNLEEKLILNQLEALDSADSVNDHRESVFNKWKTNLAFMIKQNTIDWNTQKELFKIKKITDCKKWLIGKLQTEGLIDVSSQKIKP